MKDNDYMKNKVKKTEGEWSGYPSIDAVASVAGA